MKKLLSSGIYVFMALSANYAASYENIIQIKEAFVIEGLYGKMIVVYDGKSIVIDECHQINGIPSYHGDLLDMMMLLSDYN